jgi:hypothetical protein
MKESVSCFKHSAKETRPWPSNSMFLGVWPDVRTPPVFQVSVKRSRVD